MKTNKGISPLIATVIVVSITIAMAALVSTFLTGTMKKQTAQAGRGGEQVMECPSLMANLDISTDEGDINLDESADELTLVISNNAGSDVRGLKIRTYNGSLIELDKNPEPSTLNASTVKRVTANTTLANVNKIEVISTNCPGYKNTIVKEAGVWEIAG